MSDEMSDENKQALERALSTLREVIGKLAQGVNKAEFENEYRNKRVSPGVSVRSYLNVQRIAGNLEEDNEMLRLKPMDMRVSA